METRLMQKPRPSAQICARFAGGLRREHRAGAGPARLPRPSKLGHRAWRRRPGRRSRPCPPLCPPISVALAPTTAKRRIRGGLIQKGTRPKRFRYTSLSLIEPTWLEMKTSDSIWQPPTIKARLWMRLRAPNSTSCISVVPRPTTVSSPTWQPSRREAKSPIKTLLPIRRFV